jgi:acetolactate synthase-1/2/3 large subunit
LKNYLDGGEAILEAFRNLGIDYIMSSPGSEWGALWEALARQKVSGKSGPTYIHCWHEMLAVNLATGYTAATGKLQAVVLHTGVGVLHGANGIHGAQLSETPMLVLSGEALTYGERPGFDPGRQWYTTLSVVGGPQRFAEPIVKWAQQAGSAETLYGSVVRAGEIAVRTPKGPTYLNVPIENMVQAWRKPARLRKVPPAPKRRPADADVERVARLLIESRNPVIMAGAPGRDPDGFTALVALAELLAIPVVESTVADFANFPKDHRLYQGHNFQPLRDMTDLVLTVSCRAPWYPPGNRPPNATVVAVDDYPYKQHMVYQNLQADDFLEGDPAASLCLLADAVRAGRVDAEKVNERRSRWEAAHVRLREASRGAEAEASQQRPIHPVWLCAALNEAMPDDAIYVEETTTHREVVQRHLDWNEPGRYFKVPSGLGQGLGVALGIKLANPNHPVVALIGDGAFLYNPVPQSFGLSIEAKLPILIVVFNNLGYQSMMYNQLAYYPDGAGKQNNLFYGMPINAPDYGDLVKPFGGYGRKVEDPAELIGALREGLRAVEGGKTAVINVVLGPNSALGPTPNRLRSSLAWRLLNAARRGRWRSRA